MSQPKTMVPNSRVPNSIARRRAILNPTESVATET